MEPKFGSQLSKTKNLTKSFKILTKTAKIAQKCQFWLLKPVFVKMSVNIEKCNEKPTVLKKC